MPISILPERPPYIPEESWLNLERIYGSADNVCRRDEHGTAYIDVNAMDVLIESTGAHHVIRAWRRFKSQADGHGLRSAGSHDAVINWHEFLAYHQSREQELTASRQSPHQEYTRLARHPYRNAEEAWAAVKNVEPIPALANLDLTGVAEYLTRQAEALRSPGATRDAGDEAVEPAGATVSDCFSRAGLWWVVAFFALVVVLILAVIASGGTILALAGAVLPILLAAGIGASIAGVIALVTCLVDSAL
jgi:hypothetical protein